MPDFSMRRWETGKRMTLLEAFGVTRGTLQVPPLQAKLPKYSGKYQKPIQVQQTGGMQGGSSSGSGGGGGPGGPGAGASATGQVPQQGGYKQYARKLLVKNGWGNQWPALNNIIMAESGWNPRVFNYQGSGAYGIAQADGHGTSKTRGTQANQYGGFGLTDKQAKEANSGNGYWQLVWMMNYIRAVYGDPNKAWAYHQANGSY